MQPTSSGYCFNTNRSNNPKCEYNDVGVMHMLVGAFFQLDEVARQLFLGI